MYRSARGAATSITVRSIASVLTIVSIAMSAGGCKSNKARLVKRSTSVYCFTSWIKDAQPYAIKVLHASCHSDIAMTCQSDVVEMHLD